MKHNCNPEDFCLGSLFKLTETTKKHHSSEISTFDVMMEDGTWKDEDRGVLTEYYAFFNTLYTVHATDRLTAALNKIQHKLLAEGYNRDVCFAIFDGINT